MGEEKISESDISFGIISDLQFCDLPPYKNRYFVNSIQKFKKVIETFNNHPLDFVVNLGDMIDRHWKSYNEILPLFDELKAPVYHVLGNHDYEVENQYRSIVHEKIGTKRYYDFSIAKWRFIVLDGNEISTFANPEGSPNYQKAKLQLEKMESQKLINANFWNGGIGVHQQEWLVKTLTTASENHELVIIFCHYPIYPEDKHNLLNDRMILETIIDFDFVKAWFNGHNHKGNYGIFKNIHFVNVNGIVETENELAFSIVNIQGNTMSIKGFGNEPSRILSF